MDRSQQVYWISICFTSGFAGYFFGSVRVSTPFS